MRFVLPSFRRGGTILRGHVCFYFHSLDPFHCFVIDIPFISSSRFEVLNHIQPFARNYLTPRKNQVFEGKAVASLTTVVLTYTFFLCLFSSVITFGSAAIFAG